MVRAGQGALEAEIRTGGDDRIGSRRLFPVSPSAVPRRLTDRLPTGLRRSDQAHPRARTRLESAFDSSHGFHVVETPMSKCRTSSRLPSDSYNAIAGSSPRSA